MFDIATGQSQQVGIHDAAIKCVRWIDAPTGGILATGSWDKTIKVRESYPNTLVFRLTLLLKYWDLRTPNPIATVQMAERVYTMDVQYPLMVVGTAERHIQIINLSNPTTVFKVCIS